YAILVTTVTTAISYALGVIAEPISRIIFEYLLQSFIGKKRFTGYLEKHRQILDKSPILRRYTPNNSEKKKAKLKESQSAMGEMRFYVLMKSSELYTEIESQLNRLRFIRVLVIVEIIIILALIFQINRNPLPVFQYLMNIVIVIVIVNIFAINSRLNRYYRAVERSYEALVFDQYGALGGNDNVENNMQ
ncbi:MAG: hypothetical protein ACE5IR_09460, partial [bacterium]